MQLDNLGAAQKQHFQLLPAMAPTGPTTVAQWPSYYAIVQLNQMNHSHIFRLQLMPCFHPTAVLDGDLIATYAYGSKILPEELQGIVVEY